MPVKKIVPKSAGVVRKLPASVVTTVMRKLPQKEDLSGLTLPDEPTQPDADINHYAFLIYGREKIGKTTVLNSFPDSIFFCTEPGTKGLLRTEFNADNGGVKTWEHFRKGVDLLVANKGKFKTLLVDTIDRAYDMCLDWVCENKGIEYPGTDSSGKEDFGKSWRAVKMEFLEQMHRVAQSGMGIVFTSHATESEFKNKKTGDSYTRIFPSMSNQARKVIEAMVDFFFYAEYMRASDGSTARVFICEGDETIWAGSREGLGGTFPKFLPMLKEGGYDLIKSAFIGEDVGLDPVTLIPSRQTSKTALGFMQKERVKAAATAAQK